GSSRCWNGHHRLETTGEIIHALVFQNIAAQRESDIDHLCCIQHGSATNCQHPVALVLHCLSDRHIDASNIGVRRDISKYRSAQTFVFLETLEDWGNNTALDQALIAHD